MARDLEHGGPQVRRDAAEIRAEFRDVRTELHDVRTKLDEVTSDVNILIRCQQERDRDSAD